MHDGRSGGPIGLADGAEVVVFVRALDTAAPMVVVSVAEDRPGPAEQVEAMARLGTPDVVELVAALVDAVEVVAGESVPAGTLRALREVRAGRS